MADFSIIGKPIALIDSAGKTTGAGKYADDLSLPGMLIGKIIHSPYPHALVKRIDASRALALDGVVAVVTGADAPNKYGILPVGHDETALAVDKVRYVGDNVACVVAESESIAEQALELIDVEYQALPAYFDPEESMKATSDFIHPETRGERPVNFKQTLKYGFALTKLMARDPAVHKLAAEVQNLLKPRSVFFEPEFMQRVVKNGEVVRIERIVAGETGKQTPIFTRPMRRITFKPTWKVPEGAPIAVSGYPLSAPSLVTTAGHLASTWSPIPRGRFHNP